MSFYRVNNNEQTLATSNYVDYIDKKGKTMAENKINEAAENLSQCLCKATEVITNSAVETQQRNMAYAASIVEKGMDVFKNNVDQTQKLMQEMINRSQKPQEVFETFSKSAIAAQEQNVKFGQSIYENSLALFQGQVETTKQLAQALAEQMQKQQDAYQVLMRETMNTYLGAIPALKSYARQEPGYEGATR